METFFSFFSIHIQKLPSLNGDKFIFEVKIQNRRRMKSNVLFKSKALTKRIQQISAIRHIHFFRLLSNWYDIYVFKFNNNSNNDSFSGSFGIKP